MDCNGSDIFISLMDDSARNEAQDEWAVGGAAGRGAGSLEGRGRGHRELAKSSLKRDARNWKLKSQRYKI